MKRLATTCAILSAVAMFCPGCGIYTFSGSTLPAHIRTVSIPLFENRTMEPGIAEEMTRRIRQEYISNNALRVVEGKAHSTLEVSLTQYRGEPYNYDQTGNVREYRVVIGASAVFRDERKGQNLWEEERISVQGVYASTETESQGKERAMAELANILIENTISGW